MTFQIQITRHVRGNMAETERRVGMFGSHKDLSMVLETL